MDSRGQDAMEKALLVAQIFWPRLRLMEESIAFLLEEARPRVLADGHEDRIRRLADLQQRLLSSHQIPGAEELDDLLGGSSPPRP